LIGILFALKTGILWGMLLVGLPQAERDDPLVATGVHFCDRPPAHAVRQFLGFLFRGFFCDTRRTVIVHIQRRVRAANHQAHIEGIADDFPDTVAVKWAARPFVAHAFGAKLHFHSIRQPETEGNMAKEIRVLLVEDDFYARNWMEMLLHSPETLTPLAYLMGSVYQ
jgi:hypothetical protein